MVRIYGLTSILPLKENLQKKQQIQNSGTYSAFKDNTFAAFEKMKKNPEVFKSYQLTEINLGYEFIRNSTKKRFFLCIYRNDTGWIKIRMLSGSTQFRLISNKVYEFLIASSKLYPNDIEFDTQIILRCIRNTKTRGVITKEEENCYENYLERIKDFCGSPEDAFSEIPFILPHETHPKTLKQKIHDIGNLVKMVCDPENKNEINAIPENARFVQEIRCFRPQIIRRGQAKHSHYFDFICQNSSEKNSSRKSILVSERYAPANVSTSCNEYPSDDNVPQESNNNSRKRGRPSVYENEEKRKMARLQSSKEYNKQLKLQRENLKTEIMDIERKHKDLAIHLHDLRKVFASTRFENGDNSLSHQVFQRWKNLFGNDNENVSSAPQNDTNDTNYAKDKNVPQNSLTSSNSTATGYRRIPDKSQKLLTRREKQKIAIQRFREKQKLENQLLVEKKNLLLCAIQEITETTELIEKLLSSLKTSVLSELSDLQQASSKTNLTTLDRDFLTTPRTITSKLDNRKNTNYERKVDTNSDTPVCIETCAFSTVIELALQNCGITELSNFRALPSTLISLNLSNNDIRYISSSISDLKNLKELNLSCNYLLETIPWEDLPSELMRLNIQDTNVTHIPTTIEKLHLIETLELGNKNLEYVSWESISETLQKISIKKATNKLNRIDFNDKCNLSVVRLDDIYFEGDNSLDLLLSNADIEKPLQSLQSLHLSNNGLKKFSWNALPSSLEVLKIENNSLNQIGHISHLNGLKRLEVNFNNIKSISDTIGKLQTLTIMQMENNDITSLPNGFENLLNLKYLDLSSNKFDYESGNLEKSLWKRLPQNLVILRLDDNNLHKIPCLLKKLKLECLAVNGCKLDHICPFFITEGQKNMFVLEIRDNLMLKNLSIIPSIIYQPPQKKSVASNQLPLAELNLITDTKNFVNTSRFPAVQRKPLYKFEYCEETDGFSSCKCCARCGDITDKKRIEQMMVMDINLCVTASDSKYSNFLFQKLFDDETLMDYLDEINEKTSTKKDHIYGPGTWKTMVKTRLCPDCFDTFKLKTDTAFNDFQILNAPKKRKKAMEIARVEPDHMPQTVSTTNSLPNIETCYQRFNDYRPYPPYIRSSNHMYPSYINSNAQRGSDSDNDIQILTPPNFDINYYQFGDVPDTADYYPPFLDSQQPSNTVHSDIIFESNSPENISSKIIKIETSEFDPSPSANHFQNSEELYLRQL